MKLSQGMQHIFIYGLAVLLQKFSGFLLLPFTTHYLSPAQFGTLEILVTIINFFLLFDIGSEALQRFAGQKHAAYTLPKILMSIIAMGMALSAILLILSYALNARLILLLPNIQTNDVWLTCIAIIQYIFIVPLFTALRVEGRAFLYMFISILQLILQFSLTIYFLKQGWGITAILIANVVAGAWVLTIFVWTYRKTIKYKELSQKVLKAMIHYQLPLIGSGLMLFCTQGLDRWFLAAFVNEAALGIFAVGMKFVVLFAFMFQIFQMWWMPKRFQVLEQADGKETNARVANYLVVILFALMMMVAIATWIAMHWFVPASYHGILPYIPWLLLAFCFKLLADILNIGIYLPSKPVMPFVYNAITASLALLGYIILVSKYGIAGLTATLLIIYAIRMFLFYYGSQRRCYLKYKSKALAALGVVTFIALLSFYTFTTFIYQFLAIGVALMFFIFWVRKHALLPSIKDLIQLAKP